MPIPDEIPAAGVRPMYVVLCADPTTEKVVVVGGLLLTLTREEAMEEARRTMEEKQLFGPYCCFDMATQNFPERLHAWLEECKLPASEIVQVISEFKDWLKSANHDKRPMSVRVAERRQLGLRRRERDKKRKEKQKRKRK